MSRLFALAALLVALFVSISFGASVGQTEIITSEKVTQMIKEGMSEEIILLNIHQTEVVRPSIEQQIALKRAGASDKVIAAMMNGGQASESIAEDSGISLPQKEEGDGILKESASAITGQVGKVGGFFKKPFGGSHEDGRTALASPVATAGIRLCIQSDAEGGVLDNELEDTARDMQKLASDKFSVVSSPEEADILIVVEKRYTEEAAPGFLAHKTKRIKKVVSARLAVRGPDGAWGQPRRFTNEGNDWRQAANKTLKDVEDLLGL